MLNLGDIVLLDFPYTNQIGSKVRPGLVMGENGNNSFDDVNVAYITSEVDSYAYDPSAIIIQTSDLSG